ncbi:hypothetical protein N5580_13220 [Pantoea piersonii]|uniref:Uncharacterized protein n=1 Tax=Pantoea piersonii TaxID=2364647 RepID=A0AAJ5QHN5_9GAMM|nr:hypothetical protein [Pantoea piersonii]WBG90047.1 hypothetical protein N5580_13220 [Pantoea piersonii]
MTNLTASEARRLIERLHHNQTKEHGISILEEKYLAALEVALPVLEQQERQCQKCGGTGMADSGGTQPWGEPIMVECDCQFEQQEKGNDGWIVWGEWIEWNGGECPVKESDWIEARLRDGEEAGGLACHGEWEHKNRSFDIIAYRVIEQ